MKRKENRSGTVAEIEGQGGVGEGVADKGRGFETEGVKAIDEALNGVKLHPKL